MIEARFERSIVTFDGTVIEAFFQGEPSVRHHIRHVEKAAIISDRKERQSLQITMRVGGGIVIGPCSPEAAQQAQALVAEIERVRASL
jgi:hypothetical protein